MAQQNKTEGTVFKIKRFSVHDGPGIRTSLFLKGCPLSCIWCHSPEGIDPGITIWHDRNLCIACNQCIEGCPESALSLIISGKPQVAIDRTRCQLNGQCVRNCPSGAICFTGYKMTVDEAISEIEKDMLFYQTSGGGVTLTGGEPLFQPDFSANILKMCRRRKIHTAIETCLHCEKSVIDKIIEFTDLFIIDLKIFDQDIHRAFTGVTNQLILENFLCVAASGKEIIVRIPMIDHITDTRNNIDSIRYFVAKADKKIKIEFIGFNPLARNNYEKLQIPFRLDKNIGEIL